MLSTLEFLGLISDNLISIFSEMYGTCTMEAVYGCLREGRYGFLNPIMSGKLRTRTGIKYGKVEIVAKMPRGDWLWPGRIEIRN